MPPAAAAGAALAGNVVGGIMGANAAGSAAEQQAKSAADANAMQWRMFQQQRSDQNPYQQAGVSALYGPGGIFRRRAGVATGPSDEAKQKWISERFNTLQHDPNRTQRDDAKLMLGAQNDWEVFGKQQAGSQMGDSGAWEVDPELTRSFTMDDFQKDPGYDFRMAEGQKALERSAAARGGLRGGAFAKALSKYGQDFASNEYGKAYDRFNNDRSNRFNRLQSLAGGGQTANAQLAGASQNYANQYGQNAMGAANAQGAAGIAGANAWGNAFAGIGKAGMDYAAGQQQQNWMDQMLSAQKARSNPFIALNDSAVRTGRLT